MTYCDPAAVRSIFSCSPGPVTNGASAWAAFPFYPEDADVLAQGARGSQGKRRESRPLVSRSMPEVRPGSERRRISFIGLEACVQLPMAPMLRRDDAEYLHRKAAQFRA